VTEAGTANPRQKGEVMIYTRFGTPAKIIRGDLETCKVSILTDDGRKIKTYTHELRADDGLKEIIEAIQATQKQEGIDCSAMK
jgi:hypothetical protein